MLPALHIHDLPLTPHFAPSEVRHMMPIYKPSILDNLFTIFKYYISHSYSNLLIPTPDPSLLPFQSSRSPLYQHCQVLWHEGFDEEEQHLKNTLNLGSALVNYIYGQEKEGGNTKFTANEHDYVKRVDIFSCQQESVERHKNKFPLAEPSSNIVGYNFMIHEGRIYAIFGRSLNSRANAAISAAILRQWNLKRLKIQQIGSFIDVEHLDRTCEHLFTICRGFMREVNDDYNTHRVNLRNFIHKIQHTELNEGQIANALKEARLDSSSLPCTLKYITYHVTYRQELSQADLWNVLGECITEWLLQTPLNVSTSYCASLVYEAGTHNFILTLGLYYNTVEQREADQESLNKVSSNIEVMMADQMSRQERVEESSLKASMKLMSKYEASSRKDIMNSSRISVKSLNQSMISETGSKLSIKKIARLQNEIYEILKFLEANQKILTPTEIDKRIRTHLTYLENDEKRKKGYSEIREEQVEPMEVLEAINEELSPDEVYLLLTHYPNDAGVILQGFLQKSKHDNAITIGKLIAREHLEKLYSRSLQDGLSSHRHSLIPFFLKKMVLKYGQEVMWSPLKVEEVSVPQLVEVIEGKKYDSSFYSAIMSIVFPQLFQAYEESIKPIAPLLSLYLEHLLRQDHHFELVYNFIGELLFEVCYFTQELKLNSLSNSVYFEDKYKRNLTIKEKKVIFMIREGGFRGFGFEVKNLLVPLIQQYQNYSYPEAVVYNIYSVNRPADLLKLFQILGNSHFTESIIRVGTFLQNRRFYSDVLTGSNPLTIFLLVNRSAKNWFEEAGRANPANYNSISDQIIRSESGIFRDMVRLNPKVKIAGIELNTAIKNLTDSRVKGKLTASKKGCIDANEAVGAILTPEMKMNFEYLELASYMKERYINYHTLSETEKSYFRDCADNVIEKKEAISSYVLLSTKMKKATGGDP